MLRRDVPLYAAITLLFCWPIFQSPMGYGILDWDQHFFLYAAVAKSVFAFHQLPFWNPWYCGGSPLWQNPEVAIVSPAYLFALVMPLQVALKVNIAVHFFIALLGMNVLLRRSFQLTSTPLVAFLSVVFACCGGLALHVAVGHLTFLNFCYLPWLVHFGIQAAERPAARPIVLGGAVIALSVYGGGIYAIVMTGTGLAVFAAVASVLRRDWRPLAAVAAIGVAGLAFAAPKLAPIAAMFADPLMVDGRSGLAALDFRTWAELKLTLVEGTRPANWPKWYEHGNYIGLVAGILLLATLVYWMTIRPTKDRWLGWSLAVAAILLLLLTRGPFADYSPYTLLRHLPIYSGLREAGRYSMVFVLFGLAAAAAVVRAGQSETSLSPGLRRVAMLVMALAGADIIAHNREVFAGAFAQPPVGVYVDLKTRTPAPALDVTTDGGTPAAMLYGIQQNRDVVNCYRLFAPKLSVMIYQGIIQPGPRVAVTNVAYSPSRIDMHVSTATAGQIVLNQNYITGWHATRGKFSVDPATGLAMTTLPAGFDGPVSFYYRPPGLIAGSIILLLALVAAGYLLIWRSR